MKKAIKNPSSRGFFCTLIISLQVSREQVQALPEQEPVSFQMPFLTSLLKEIFVPNIIITETQKMSTRK